MIFSNRKCEVQFTLHYKTHKWNKKDHINKTDRGLQSKWGK